MAVGVLDAWTLPTPSPKAAARAKIALIFTRLERTLPKKDIVQALLLTTTYVPHTTCATHFMMSSDAHQKQRLYIPTIWHACVLLDIIVK